MFEITDEFLAQAGFTQLPDSYKEQLRQQATESVQQMIGDRIAEAVGEERSQEIEKLIDEDQAAVERTLSRMGDYRNSDEFKAIEQLGMSNGASDTEIIQQFAVLAWFKEQNIDIQLIVQQSMNDTMTELQRVREEAKNALG